MYIEYRGIKNIHYELLYTQRHEIHTWNICNEKYEFFITNRQKIAFATFLMKKIIEASFILFEHSFRKVSKLV